MINLQGPDLMTQATGAIDSITATTELVDSQVNAIGNQFAEVGSSMAIDASPLGEESAVSLDSITPAIDKPQNIGLSEPNLQTDTNNGLTAQALSSEKTNDEIAVETKIQKINKIRKTVAESTGKKEEEIDSDVIEAIIDVLEERSGDKSEGESKDAVNNVEKKSDEYVQKLMMLEVSKKTLYKKILERGKMMGTEDLAKEEAQKAVEALGEKMAPFVADPNISVIKFEEILNGKEKELGLDIPMGLLGIMLNRIVPLFMQELKESGGR